LIEHEPVVNLLRKWLEKNSLKEFDWVDRILKATNVIIKRVDPTQLIGPSYFMVNGLDRDIFYKVWNYSILPALEDTLLDQEALQEIKDLPNQFDPQFGK